MWPSSRRPWPPPCSVRDSRGVGASRLGLGEHGSTRVPRGRRTRLSERFRPGHGPSRFQPVGRAQVGSGGGRVAALEWHTAAIDTSMVSPVRRDGTVRAGTATTNGKSLDVARSQKERRYPGLSGENGRARLVVIGTEVGGRWSVGAATFQSCLATVKARDAPLTHGGSVPLPGSAGGKACWGAPQLRPSLSLSSRVLLQRRGRSHPLHERRAG